MKAIALIGNKKSGKTTLASQLCSYLDRLGYRVAAAKFSHHAFDQEDTDTALLSAHTQAVIGISPDQSLVQWKDQKSLFDLLPLISADVLVVEGGRDLEAMPRIVLPKEDESDRDLGADLALAAWQRTYGAHLPVLHSVQEVAHKVLEQGFLLAGNDCGACGRENCGLLARDILQGRARPEDCKAQHSALRIQVNGRTLGMNPFVENLIAGCIKGMLEQLKGYAPGTIEISLEG